MIRIAAFALLVCVMGTPDCFAGFLVPPNRFMLRVDWQEPAFLPPRFRNHCTFENFFGRPYCSDHCGVDYQIYYCSGASFGCCHLGRGYCDFHGSLRCHP
jgi:hypothetical protein